MKLYKVKVNGNPYEVAIASVDENGVAKVSVNGKDYMVEVGARTVAPADAGVKAPAVVTPSVVPAASAASSGTGKTVTTPLPGVIIAVNVNLGDRVSAGQSLATLESMKMENAIEAESDGVVREIHVQKGDSVLEGAKIVTLG